MDADGEAWETVWDIISLGSSIAEVVAMPTDPWAWAGLIGDIIDVALPGIGGLGETVDVVKTSVRVIDTGDNIIDAAKQARRVADVADDIKDATGAYVVLYEGGQHYIGKGGFQRAIKSAQEHMTNTNKVSAIVWAPTSSRNSAFVTEYFLQSTLGSVRRQNNAFNILTSPGKKILAELR